MPLVHIKLRTALGLWVSLVLPSIWLVDKYVGMVSAIAYVLLTLAIVFNLSRLMVPISERHTKLLAAVTFLGLLLIFVVVYPVANTHEPSRGSDDDDALDLAVRQLLSGNNPYRYATYLGNNIHHFAGAFILALPFTLIWTSALQNVFWLLALFVTAKRNIATKPLAIWFVWIPLALSPAVLQQIVTGTGYIANSLYVLLATWWLIDARRKWPWSILLGVAVASRGNFLFVLPLVFGYLSRHHGTRAAIWNCAIVLVTSFALTVPFYLNAPESFAPLEATNRLTQFDQIIPHASVFIVLGMIVVTLALALSRMDVVQDLFRNCAWVQAIPVMSGTLLGRDLEFGSYGLFFLWFAVIASFPSMSQLNDDHMNCAWYRTSWLTRPNFRSHPHPRYKSAH